MAGMGVSSRSYESEEDPEADDLINELSIGNDEQVDVYEENPVSGHREISPARSYKLNSVIDRVGVKFNLDEKYFDQIAME